jgi:hypothetical protein
MFVSWNGFKVVAGQASVLLRAPHSDGTPLGFGRFANGDLQNAVGVNDVRQIGLNGKREMELGGPGTRVSFVDPELTGGGLRLGGRPDLYAEPLSFRVNLEVIELSPGEIKLEQHTLITDSCPQGVSQRTGQQIGQRERLHSWGGNSIQQPLNPIGSQHRWSSIMKRCLFGMTGGGLCRQLTHLHQPCQISDRNSDVVVICFHNMK